MTNTTTTVDHQQEFYHLLMQVQHDTQIIRKITNGQIGHQKYKYAPLEEVQKMLHPILKKYGIGYIQHILPSTDTYIATTIYSKNHRETFFFPVNEYTDDPKNMGKVISYSKRYALLAHFGIIVEGEDNDANGIKAKYTNDEIEEVRLTQEQFDKTMQADDQGIQKVLDTYNGKNINGKKYLMKKARKEKLVQKIT